MPFQDISAVESYAAIAGVVITALGLVFVIFQLRELKLSVRSAAHASIYERAAEFRSHLVEYPQLRKYFFEEAAIDESDENYNRVLSIAEMYLNYLEQIFLTNESLGRQNLESIDRFITAALGRSPILQRSLTERSEAYSLRFSRYVSSLLSKGTKPDGGPDQQRLHQ